MALTPDLRKDVSPSASGTMPKISSAVLRAREEIAAGREKLRASGFAPPSPRGIAAPTLVQLQSNAHRCPYCGSTETRLENIFGPTPCRSLRYCGSCKQPFEQFKTI